MRTSPSSNLGQSVSLAIVLALSSLIVIVLMTFASVNY
jgi:hypothetical protein